MIFKRIVTNSMQTQFLPVTSERTPQYAHAALRSHPLYYFPDSTELTRHAAIRLPAADGIQDFSIAMPGRIIADSAE